MDAARVELARALGLTWTEPLERQSEGWEIRVCFSRQGPPHIELIEGPPGSPWDSTAGSRIDHIGYWARDVGRARDELAAAGVAVEVDGTRSGAAFTYQRGRDSGLRVELIDADTRAAFFERWGLQDPDHRPPPRTP
jgi:hypothetical protein